MAYRHASGGNGAPRTAAELPPLRRRLSMDEDLLYHQIVTATTSRRPSQPPPAYKEEPRPPRSPSIKTAASIGDLRARAAAAAEGSEMLPDYSCSINCEGVFTKKMEIENTTKRAEDRRWHSVYVVLTGTALDIYEVKKEWGWGRGRDGPGISPDNPPWLKKGKLEKRYSLQYADVGIALDYQKRRHVIRVRAETDQFLLACIELSTFVKWLEVLFAAIDVAAPIDERNFPRDQSIPRIQRIRWYRGQSPARRPSVPTSPRSPGAPPATANPEGGGSGSQLHRPSAAATAAASTPRRPSTAVPIGVLLFREAGNPEGAGDDDDGLPAGPVGQSGGLEAEHGFDAAAAADDNDDDDGDGFGVHDGAEPATRERDRDREREREREMIARLSTTSYPNAEIDYLTGKWAPVHHWSEAHDMLYAKLCYSALLFKSPRKSNYIINKGKKWFVDWTTGNMVRVLPPGYDDVEPFGPWQVIHTENKRI